MAGDSLLSIIKVDTSTIGRAFLHAIGCRRGVL